MTQDILEQIKRELTNGHAKRGHPFRYFTLATNNGKTSRLRTVVLRKMRSDFTLIVYTDLRSEKIKHINKNSAVNALFYNPKKLTQVTIEGHAKIITDSEKLKAYWTNIPEKSRKDYTAIKPPGTAIKNPDNVEYNFDNPNFCIIEIVPETIEYLQLKRPNHLRVLFKKNDGDFDGEFLVP
ncbi:pyridoxamine 5'-phosphate oxidase family protein [Winogradskyella litorisediminis]|uniref:Pyridoxamine 5'-phosphate oxidase family protein n=1 Tax=Winogradskyella litorisediminis TaxID=1156618 RepID=A0ABW3N2P1_9FLAO